MSGLLRFLAFFAVLGGFLLLVGLPLVAGPFLTQLVRDMGLRSESLQVTVAMFDPFLVLGRSRSTHVSARDVNLSPAMIGSLELTLGDVSFFDRTWRTIDGEISDITVSTSGEDLHLGSIRVSGEADAATATARLSAQESESLIRVAANRQGLHLDDVSFSSGGVSVTIAGVPGDAQLEVRGGALVLFPGTGHGGVPLIQPAPADPWQLEETWIGDGGLNVRGVVDTTVLASQMGAIEPATSAE